MAAKRILIVNGRQLARRRLRESLVSLGYVVDEASGGLAACRMAAERQSDLILMDLVMTGLDGVEVCRQIKHDNRTAVIPVIVVATSGNRERLDDAFAAGADAYLIRPFSVAELRVRIGSFVVKRELSQAVARLEGELREKAIYENIFEHMPEGVLSLNMRSEVIYINRAALDILGYSREEMRHLTLQDFWAEESYREAMDNHMGFFFGSDFKKKYDLLIKTRSGEKRWVTVSVSEHRLQGHDAILVFTDLAAERQRQKRHLASPLSPPDEHP